MLIYASLFIDTLFIVYIDYLISIFMETYYNPEDLKKVGNIGEFHQPVTGVLGQSLKR